jgi:hypothetical protein
VEICQDGLAEKLLRLCERLGVPHDIAEAAVATFERGRRTYGPWNHLSLSPAELTSHALEEQIDTLNYIALIPWSIAHHKVCAETVKDEDADAVIDADLVERVLDLYRQIEAAEEPVFSAPRG